jgi:hypothetical protein
MTTEQTEQTMMAAEDKPSQIDIDIEELWQKVGIEHKSHIFNAHNLADFHICIRLYDSFPQELRVNDDKRQTMLKFEIEDWQDRTLFYQNFNNAKELKHILTELLPTIEYSKLLGKFVSPIAKETYFQPRKSYDHFIERMKNVKMDYQQCPCCLEPTFAKTKGACDHHICRECEYKLKRPICPMCRGCICGDCEVCVGEEDE